MNQSDDEEKGFQVRMMGDIYRSASRVLMWLGKANNATLRDFIPHVLASKQLKHSANDWRSYGQLTRKDIEAYKILPKISMSDSSEYDAFWYVASNPYFRRLWIIQEVALAKEALLFCDYWCISWESFEEAFNFLFGELDLFASQKIGTGVNRHIYSLISTARRVSLNERPSFLRLMYIHALSQASDPRDKVFGLKELAADAEHIEIVGTQAPA
jgi:hypothetical protein